MLIIIRNVSRIKWGNSRKGEVPSLTPWCRGRRLNEMERLMKMKRHLNEMKMLMKRKPSGRPQLLSPTLLAYITQPKQFKWWKLTTVVGSIAEVGVLACYALLHFVCDLKTTKMNT